MIELMRNDFKESIFPHIQTAHAGLLMQRGLPVWEEKEKSQKQNIVEKITNVKTNELYLLAFKRWLYNSYNTQEEQTNPNFAHVSAKLHNRLYTGLPLGGTLETGASTHHTYGMPLLTGSAIKGAVRNYTENLFDTDIIPKDKNGNALDKQQILDVLFGSSDDENDSAGYIIWHDAWWIPHTNADGSLSTGDKNKPFVAEIITVHHQDYYGGKLDEALDMESPIPNQQIAIQGSFYFTLQGDDEWVEYAKKLLVATLKHQGIGSKVSSGYGYFSLDSQQIDTIMEEKLKADEEKSKAKALEYAQKNASPLTAELLQVIEDNNWRVSNDTVKTTFSAVVVKWIDKLEQNYDDKEAINLFIAIFKIHLGIHWKKAKNKKQKERVERLKVLQAD